MTTQELIINYMRERSKGAVVLNYKHATEIINLVTGQAPYVVVYHYSGFLQRWEQLRTVKTTILSIQVVKEKFGDGVPNLERFFYRYECFNEGGGLITIIHSCYIHLFD